MWEGACLCAVLSVGAERGAELLAPTLSSKTHRSSTALYTAIAVGLGHGSEEADDDDAAAGEKEAPGIWDGDLQEGAWMALDGCRRGRGQAPAVQAPLYRPRSHAGRRPCPRGPLAVGDGDERGRGREGVAEGGQARGLQDGGSDSEDE